MRPLLPQTWWVVNWSLTVRVAADMMGMMAYYAPDAVSVSSPTPPGKAETARNPADDHRIRERLEAQEERLSPFAQRSQQSRGRQRSEEPSAMRTAFQRDRDRIVHSKAFRRLKHKTQVFIAPTGDHFVTRLTHTIEVSQVARSIARALNLNEDLVEAISLGHDLGHSPFGHLGEEALNGLSPHGFVHAEQSLRVVDVLEKDGAGLNLTWEVRQGILHHSKPRGSFQSAQGADEQSLEAQVCRLADAVAYINHDIDDAVRAWMLCEEDLPSQARLVLGNRHGQRLNTLITDIVDESWPVTGEDGATHSVTPPRIRMSRTVEDAALELREFLFQRVYIPNGRGTPQGDAAWRAVEGLYAHYTRHPEAIASEYGEEAAGAKRRVVDFISGMTDLYAMRAYEAIA